MGRVSVIVLAVLVVASTAVGIALLGDAASDHPDEWDTRVEGLVAFVEGHRDLTFEHPVAIEFLGEQAFEKRVRVGEGGMSAEERSELQQYSAFLRAFGLLETDIDLLQEMSQLNESGIAGYYDPDTGQIVVKGKKLTVDTRPTVVHELTHALQDQHFDLGRFGEFDAEALPYRTLAEGDADRIEAAYIESLGDKQLARLQKETKVDPEYDEEALEDFPPVLMDTAIAPYALGELLVAVLTHDQYDMIDAAFEDPPASEEHILDPWTYINSDVPEEVTPPPLRPGETEVEVAGRSSGTFGALGWYLFLSTRLPAITALRAVDGYGGDSFVTFEKQGQTCVRALYLGEERDETREMTRALHAWVDLDPEGRRFRNVTPVAKDRSIVEFTSCDPGTRAEKFEFERDLEDTPLLLPILRGAITLGAIELSLDEDVARCMAYRVFNESDAERWKDILLDPDAAITDLQQAAARHAEECRATGAPAP